MRIWDVPCSELDRQHLLGEHRELHAIWNIITQGKRGYANHPEVKRWRGHINALSLRHTEQIGQMSVRGYNHNSPLMWVEGLQGGSLDKPKPITPIAEQRRILKERRKA
jgi:hypothetical protein